MENVKSAMEVAMVEVKKAVKTTKIVEVENSTGTSFFQGKDRLCKILKTKKGLTLEINVELPKDIEETFGPALTKISYAEAHKKHLGTLKYYARNIDQKDIPALVKAMVIAFKAQLAAKETPQISEQAAQ